MENGGENCECDSNGSTALTVIFFFGSLWLERRGTQGLVVSEVEWLHFCILHASATLFPPPSIPQKLVVVKAPFRFKMRLFIVYQRRISPSTNVKVRFAFEDLMALNGSGVYVSGEVGGR